MIKKSLNFIKNNYIFKYILFTLTIPIITGVYIEYRMEETKKKIFFLNSIISLENSILNHYEESSYNEPLRFLNRSDESMIIFDKYLQYNRKKLYELINRNNNLEYRFLVKYLDSYLNKTLISEEIAKLKLVENIDFYLLKLDTIQLKRNNLKEQIKIFNNEYKCLNNNLLDDIIIEFNKKSDFNKLDINLIKKVKDSYKKYENYNDFKKNLYPDISKNSVHIKNLIENDKNILSLISELSKINRNFQMNKSLDFDEYCNNLSTYKSK